MHMRVGLLAAGLLLLAACSSQPPLLCDLSLPGDPVLLAVPDGAFGASAVVEVCIGAACTYAQEVTVGSTVAFSEPDFLPENGTLRVVIKPVKGQSRVVSVQVAPESFEPKGAGCGTARRVGLRLAEDGRSASQVPFRTLDKQAP